MPVYFTKEHEWIRVEGDTATVGISTTRRSSSATSSSPKSPKPGRKLTKGQEAAVVESVKAASDVYAPVSGEVIEGNPGGRRRSGAGQQRPEGEGWFFKLKLDNPGELDGLMDESAYRDWVKTL